MAHTSHATIGRSQAAHTLPAASHIAESPHSLVDAERGGAREHGSKHTDACHHAEELAESLLAAVLVQPPSACSLANEAEC